MEQVKKTKQLLSVVFLYRRLSKCCARMIFQRDSLALRGLMAGSTESKKLWIELFYRYKIPVGIIMSYYISHRNQLNINC